MKKLLPVFLLTITVMLIAACKKDAKTKPTISITGEWRLDHDLVTDFANGKVTNEQKYVYPGTATMVFNEDKTGKYLISDFNYALKDNTIHFVYSTYEVDAVISSHSDKEMVITFEHFTDNTKGSETGYRLTEHLYK